MSAIEQIATHLKDLGSPVSDVQVMSKILLTLPPSYRQFLSAWDNVPIAEKNIKLLTSRLVNEESRTKQYNQGGADPSDQAFFAANSPQPKAFPAHSWNPGTRGGSRGNKSYRGRRAANQNYNRNITCDYCHIRGHSSSICRHKIRDNQVHDQRSMKSEGTRFGLAAKEDSTNQTTNESTDGNDTELCYLSSFSCLSLVAKNSSIWYADSGATMHMTDQLSAFVN